MSGLESGLLVRDIATFDVQSCDAAASSEAVLSQTDLAPFDYIPVRSNGAIVGVLERPNTRGVSSAGKCMKRLDDSMLVSAQEPLKSFVPSMPETPYRLVVRRTKIEGIVTNSDVHKLPVRLLAFALVTHLEATMASIIERELPNDAWLDKLSPVRLAKLREKSRRLKRNRFDPPLLELTEFADKRDILRRIGELGTGKQREQATKDFKHIEELRNQVAHAATYAGTDQELKEFVHLLQLAEDWIDRLSVRSTPEEVAA